MKLSFKLDSIDITIVDTDMSSERDEMRKRVNELEDRGYYNLTEEEQEEYEDVQGALNRLSYLDSLDCS